MLYLLPDSIRTSKVIITFTAMNLDTTISTCTTMWGNHGRLRKTGSASHFNLTWQDNSSSEEGFNIEIKKMEIAQRILPVEYFLK
jgi:hypothetical protein